MTLEPPKYVLYSHLAKDEGADLETWSAAQERPDPGSLRVVGHVERFVDATADLLTTTSYEGLLILFYSAGLEEVLRALAEGPGRDTEELRADLKRKCPEVRFAEYVRAEIERLFAHGCDGRVRVLTPLDFLDVFGRVQQALRLELRDFFVGPGSGVRYDSPKMPEAILRVRLMDTGIPVLRVDHDVLFARKKDKGEHRQEDVDAGSKNSNDKEASPLELFRPIAVSLRAYELRRGEPRINTFMFSSSYDTRHLNGADFDIWRRAFATRIFPGLRADRVPPTSGAPDWNRYARKAFDEGLARRFYGLAQDGPTLAVAEPAGLSRLGPSVTSAVISGALLCLSDSAIAYLPPYSNFQHNVSWIDDHLKFALHRELDHFTGYAMPKEQPTSHSQLRGNHVTKARPPITNLPGYVYKSYLPTLLRGMIMDGWITPDATLNLSPFELTPEMRTRREASERARGTAVLPAAIREAWRRGRGPNETQFKHDLRERAVARINEACEELASLEVDGQASLASLWVTDGAQNVFAEVGERGALVRPGATPGRLSSLHELQNDVADSIEDLVADVYTYVRLTLEWPQLCQIIAAAPQGSLRTDITYES